MEPGLRSCIEEHRRTGEREQWQNDWGTYHNHQPHIRHLTSLSDHLSKTAKTNTSEIFQASLRSRWQVANRNNSTSPLSPFRLASLRGQWWIEHNNQPLEVVFMLRNASKNPQAWRLNRKITTKCFVVFGGFFGGFFCFENSQVIVIFILCHEKHLFS